MNFMNTFSNKCFNPMEIGIDDICEEDIAHALSLLCRGGGHLKCFYSVAQHSINCAKEAKTRGLPRRLILACLLHDASEAYICDIIRPVKSNLHNYIEIEEMIMKVILKKYGLSDLTTDENEIWKQIDDAILKNELKCLMNGLFKKEATPLKSKPDFNEKNYKEVEEEFICMLKLYTNNHF